MEDRRDNPEIEETTAPLPEYEEHNASFDPDPIPGEGLSEDELQDSILADSNMSSFQKFIAKLDDKKWVLYQRILGIVLGVASAVSLFWKGGGESAEKEGAFSWGLVIAIVLAMLVPNIIEKKGMRKINKARTTLAITLGVCIVIYFAYVALVKGF